MVGTGRGATCGILVKSAEALQTAHGVKTVVLDKTGTITKGAPEVTDVVVADGGDRARLLALAYSIEARSEHPLAQAIVAYAKAQGALAQGIDGFEQIPGGGVRGVVAGRECLAGNARLMEAHTIDVAAFASRAEQLADEGKTVLYFAADGKLAGMVALADVVKPTSAAAVAELSRMGISTVMLTGDNERTAAAIQREVGVGRVIAGVLPDGKEEVVRDLQKQGAVAMVGDGINDAPALARADVGIAIGAGTDIAIESADIVLMRSDLADVPAAISLSRATLRNIKQNLFWALIYNVICIPVAAGALAFAGVVLNPMIAAAAMSCSSVCVVSNALRLRGWKPAVLKGAADGRSAAEEAPAGAQGTAEQDGPTADTGEGVPVSAGQDSEMQEDEQKEIIMEKKLSVEGMMCQHCVAHVKKALEGVDGVEEAVVDLDAKSAVAKLSADVADEALVDAVVDAGYEAKVVA